MTKPVLVIGSRHDVKLPNLHFKNIYSANGAEDLVKNYKKNFSDICHICTFGVFIWVIERTIQVECFGTEKRIELCTDTVIWYGEHNMSELTS